MEKRRSIIIDYFCDGYAVEEIAYLLGLEEDIVEDFLGSYVSLEKKVRKKSKKV